MFQSLQKLSATLATTALLLLQISFSGVVIAQDAPAGGTPQKFLITAYYSPLPGQSRYFRGNYEDELRFNGNGTHGADGTAVYPGMLAAPKSYAFGTKVFIPGLGVGTVHDRGGRIIENQDYHRIDIWMGRGEEGLARAMQWGARIVNGVIYDASSPVAETLSFSHIPQASLANVLPEVSRLFSRSLALGAAGNEVRSLQSYLKKLGFFVGPETGYFGAMTEAAVLDFQIAHQVLSSPSDTGAGVVGPRTSATLEEILENPDEATLPLVEKEPETETPPPDITEVVQPEQERDQARTDLQLISAGMSPSDNGADVRMLQLILANLGYYSAEFSENYDEATRTAVLTFQLENDVISNEADAGAGHFGPQTYSALSDILGTVEQRRATFTPQQLQIEVMVEREPVFGEILSTFPVGE